MVFSFLLSLEGQVIKTRGMRKHTFNRKQHLETSLPSRAWKMKRSADELHLNTSRCHPAHPGLQCNSSYGSKSVDGMFTPCPPLSLDLLTSGTSSPRVLGGVKMLTAPWNQVPVVQLWTSPGMLSVCPWQKEQAFCFFTCVSCVSAALCSLCFYCLFLTAPWAQLLPDWTLAFLFDYLCVLLLVSVSVWLRSSSRFGPFVVPLGVVFPYLLFIF